MGVKASKKLQQNSREDCGAKIILIMISLDGSVFMLHVNPVYKFMFCPQKLISMYYRVNTNTEITVL